VRIVMIGPFGLHPRGTMSVRALPMARALVARGHTVTILMPAWRTPDESGRRWEDEGVFLENIPLPPGIPGLFHLWTAQRLLRAAISSAPDVVHFFKPKAYSGLAHWLMRRIPRARRPRLVVDTDDWEGPGGWNELSTYNGVQRLFFAWQERWGLQHADAITAASTTLESLIWAMGVDPASVTYVPNGVGSLAPAVQHEPGQKPAPVILLYTRFFEFSLPRVIDLLVRVREKVPGVQLLVVGKGFFGEEGAFLDLARERGLADAVEYAGWVPARALPEYFSQADVAIFPYDDTLVNRTKCSVKLMDLLTAGVPVIAEAVGQNRETIQHGVTGWLVEPGDVEAFGDAVVRFLSEASLARKVGEAAARDVRVRFNWDRLVETVEQAYVES